MNRQNKSLSVLATVMAVILAVPGGAWADGGRYGNDWNKGGQGNKGYSGSHYNNHYNSHYNNYYKDNYNGHYKGGPGYYPYYYGCNNCGKSHHNNNNNNNDKLWIGLLGGGILGYTLGNVLDNRAVDEGYYPQPAATPPRTVTRYEPSYADNSCLQEREYRSKIMVGGKQVEGYGTACLQPDGSWRYGPAQPESY
jgi:hypothetical protein